ncbi:amidohydrolase family protein [Christensenellaceae bacterium OttesenSCG-928-K19]|nr:amidohydrolase family protein [Christensenellaceae bacterium OttesenSCG-928-K19]
MTDHYLIIDGHMHVYHDKIAERVIRSFTETHRMNPTKSLGTGTVRDVLGNMEKHHISYTVMANFSPVKSILENNDWTICMGEQHEGLIPLVSIHPEMQVDLVKQYIQRGARGIKMHTGIQEFEPTDRRLTPIYKYCEKHSIPITFHCGETSKVHVNDFAKVSHILPVLAAYPDLPFILTHLAAGNPDEVLYIAKTFKNAYFDTSITLTGEHCIDRIHDDFWEEDKNAIQAFRAIGCDRILFGSDYPFGNPGSDIRRILGLGLTEEETRMLLGKNSALLYKIGIGEIGR